jgi:uncharacterized membrane protein
MSGLSRLEPLTFFLLIALAGVAAGTLGALLGIGGGLIIIPTLTLLAGVDLQSCAEEGSAGALGGGGDPDDPARPSWPLGRVDMSKPADSALGSMELLVSMILRVGIVLGTALIVIGGVFLADTGQTGYGAIPPHGLSALLRFRSLGSPGHFPTTPGQLVHAALTGKPYAIIELGLLTLIATPGLGVALSVGFFAAERDRLYVVLTLLVLAVLVPCHLVGARAG